MMGLDEIKKANAVATGEIVTTPPTVVEDLSACITVLTKIATGDCLDPRLLASAMIGTLALRHGVTVEDEITQTH